MTRIHELAVCSGIGGISLGLSRAVPRLRTVCHVEKDAYPASVLSPQFVEALTGYSNGWVVCEPSETPSSPK
jgi:site-specific DNA-cytosine methylase